MWWKANRSDHSDSRAIQAVHHENGHNAALQRWEFIAGPSGLAILPAGPILTQDDLAELCDRLRQCDAANPSLPITFDLSHIEVFGPHWTLVLATFLHLAERLSATCRVTGLKAQPAAVVNLYRNHRGVRQLVKPSKSAA